jgi:hypothetical protein
MCVCAVPTFSIHHSDGLFFPVLSPRFRFARPRKQVNSPPAAASHGNVRPGRPSPGQRCTIFSGTVPPALVENAALVENDDA